MKTNDYLAWVSDEFSKVKGFLQSGDRNEYSSNNLSTEPTDNRGIKGYLEKEIDAMVEDVSANKRAMNTLEESIMGIIDAMDMGKQING